MTPETITGWFEQMGGGILVIAGVLVVAYLGIAFMRLTKKSEKQSEIKPQADMRDLPGEEGPGD